jgi:hypothetical protein
MNSGQFVRNIEQLQKLFADRFVDFSQDRGLFRTLTHFFGESYEDSEPILPNLIHTAVMNLGLSVFLKTNI